MQDFDLALHTCFAEDDPDHTTPCRAAQTGYVPGALPLQTAGATIQQSRLDHFRGCPGWEHVGGRELVQVDLHPARQGCSEPLCPACYQPRGDRSSSPELGGIEACRAPQPLAGPPTASQSLV